MAATAVTLNDLEGHSSVADLFKCNPSNICAAFYTISTDSVLARFLCISRASYNLSLGFQYVIHESGSLCLDFNCRWIVWSSDVTIIEIEIEIAIV